MIDWQKFNGFYISYLELNPSSRADIQNHNMDFIVGNHSIWNTAM